jgi:hypothetical protein
MRSLISIYLGWLLRLAFTGVVLCGLATLGCGAGATSPADSGTTSPQDACGQLAGKIYTSVDQGECGLGPNGVTLCHWTVSFDDAQNFRWAHSDVSEQGPYSCSHNQIVGQRGTNTSSIAGTIDSTTGQLTWDGMTYAPPAL